MKTFSQFPIYFIMGLILLLSSACSAILLEDLAAEEVVLKAPSNGLESPQFSQTFWWEELTTVVDGYRLEIVSPSFDSIAELVLQTEIAAENTFTVSLTPGIYQWTVVGFNSGSETNPVIRDLVIVNDSTADLSNQSLLLVSPAAGFVTNNTTLNFLWQELASASAYKIQIASPDFSNSTFFTVNETLSADNYSATLEEGIYRWRVRAENETSITPYTERELIIDLSPPEAPILLSPNNGDTLSLPAMLAWEVDNSSSEDTLYLYSDASLNTLILKEATSATSYQLNGVALDQQYYWRLRSVDAAGNTGDFSTTNNFYIE